MNGMRFAAAVALWIAGGVLFAEGRWIRPSDPNGALVWGRTDGIVFGLRSPGGMRGPRGLIRAGVARPDGTPELVNFIAVEPVTKGYGTRFSRMGFSELDRSRLDPGERGSRMWVEAVRGELNTIKPIPSLFDLMDGKYPAPRPPALEALSVRIEVEPFSNNRAHVYVIATVVSDRPNELRLAVFHHEDSAPIEELTTTATMGNYARLRHLWIKGRVLDSRDVPGEVPEFRGVENIPVSEMLRYGDGDAIALSTTNEEAPGSVSVTEAPNWTYRAPKLTQYWIVPAGHIQPDLRINVNVRQRYWASRIPIPGGKSFENFEVRQRYIPGQEFVFGLTPRSPREFTPKIPHLSTPPVREPRE
jgi:hypothetical protein